ncbi:MAG: Glycosyltransferase AglE [Methanomassiliicoccales archaeon PtaU1.Bin124]|nr:MAG: Glycosyltransferase AglE [Methanomassiliicoccales archaeon PtaU1.Bin124]
MNVSVGVCAYNEAGNIARCLESVVSQKMEDYPLIEIVVVSSGSTDATDDVVTQFSQRDQRVRLVRQEKREGKNSAVNEFMRQAKGDLLVLVNADNIVEAGSLGNLVRPFHDEKVGVAGGHPLPVNDKSTVAGFAVHMLWDMHHRLSLIYPKVGEMMAFRNLHIQIPTGMQSDEDLIRMDLEKKGYRSVYVGEATVKNKGPSTIRDYIKQRTRVNIGERYMKKWFDVDIPTWDPRFLFQALQSFIKENWRYLDKMFLAICLEAYARVYASLHVRMDKGDRPVWSIVETTKKL